MECVVFFPIHYFGQTMANVSLYQNDWLITIIYDCQLLRKARNQQ